MGGYFIEKPNFDGKPTKDPGAHCSGLVLHALLRNVAGSDIPTLGLDAKFWGLVTMAAAVIIPAALPWLDRSPVKSMRYKGILSKAALGIFVVSFIILGVLGSYRQKRNIRSSRRYAPCCTSLISF